MGHRDERPRPPHSRRAVDQRDGVGSERGDELAHQKVEVFFGLLLGFVSVGPVDHLVVGEDHRLLGFGVFQLVLPDFERMFFFLVRGLVAVGIRFELELLGGEEMVFGVVVEEGHFVLLFGHLGSLLVLAGEVAVALYLVLLDQVAQHENAPAVVLLHHPPEVVKGGRQGALRRDHPLPLHFDEIGIYVVLGLVSLGRRPQRHPRRIEGHEAGVPVELELLAVFVEFLDVVLGLRHEAEYFELGGEAALFLFEAELDEGDGLAHLLDVLVLVLPGQGQVVIHCWSCKQPIGE